MNAEPLKKELVEEVELLRSRLISIGEPYIKAVLLFGSKARGESTNRSDVDLLVLHEGCGIQDVVLRRRYLYKLFREAIRGDVDLTVVDMELRSFLKPIEVTSLLLNIYWDAIILYDSTGSLESFLRKVRERISASGLKRVRDGKAYRWILPEPLREIRIL